MNESNGANSGSGGAARQAHRVLRTETVKSEGKTETKSEAKAGSKAEAKMGSPFESVEKSVQHVVGSIEEKAASAVSSLEEKAVYAVENIDQLPKLLKESIQKHPMLAIGLGLLAGAGLKFGEKLLPPDMISNAAKSGGKLLLDRLAQSALQGTKAT